MTDSKKVPLLSDQDDAPEGAPPSYAESAATGLPEPFSDGHIFSDHPRQPSMIYSAAARENYTSRREKASWSAGFFGCFEDSISCLKACFIPCVSYGQTRHRIHHPGTPAPVFSGPCIGYLTACCCLPGSEHIFGMLQRNEIRRTLDIDQPKTSVQMGSSGRDGGFERIQNTIGFLDDAVKHLFCACCSLAQEEREVLRWEHDQVEGGLTGVLMEDDQVRAEGERLLGAEQEGLRGLRG
ncbi:PLAC8-domain-containing protein [Ascodesmis nigricans]|uniref:PLAC8-domain-containing protein n=1 Tax=Ascodesmis nigricans TaxID=341454 RepID=A0A4S2N0F2_9PEZI|nr:PLAC8-domain-containing protein [Ascodesmis nigricans]